MAVLCADRRDRETGQVGAFKQNTAPLMVVVDRVVYGDVDGPLISNAVSVKQRGLVFNPLGYSVG